MSKKKAYAQAMQALAHVYDFLGEHCTRFFYNRDFEYSVAKAGDNTTYMIDKAYRAVYIVHDDVDADKFVDDFNEKMTVVHDALRASYGLTDMGMYGRMPLPNIFSMDGVYRIDLHANYAHKSVAWIAEHVELNDNVDKNYHAISYVKNAKFVDNETINIMDDDDTERQIDTEIRTQLDALGVRWRYTQSKHIDYVDIAVNVADIARIFECDYIQARKATGKQYRYKAYYHDENGYDCTLELQSIGVMVITNRDIEVKMAGGSKTRNDALYVANHPDEIVLNLPRQINRIYKKYVKK